MGRVRDWWGSRHATRICGDKELVQPSPGEVDTFRKRRQSLWSTERNITLQAERPNLNPMLQSITCTTSTGENWGMGWNNSMFCIEQINYAVRIVSLVLILSTQIIEDIIPTSNEKISGCERLVFVQSATWRTKFHQLVMNERRECHPKAVEQKAERFKNNGRGKAFFSSLS